MPLEEAPLGAASRPRTGRRQGPPSPRTAWRCGPPVRGALRRARCRAAEVLADAGQRALVEEAGQVVGGVGQKLAAADADEQVEDTRARARRDRCPRPQLGERDMGQPERRRVALQLRQARRASPLPAHGRAAPRADRIHARAGDRSRRRPRLRRQACRRDPGEGWRAARRSAPRPPSRARPGPAASWKPRAAKCRAGAQVRRFLQQPGWRLRARLRAFSFPTRAVPTR